MSLIIYITLLVSIKAYLRIFLGWNILTIFLLPVVHIVTGSIGIHVV